MIEVEPRDVIAHRLHAHHLASRRPAGAVLDIVGACGIQNSPPGSALLALNARSHDVTADVIDQLVVERTLLQTWSMRGAPYYFPTADAPIFTTGVLPPTEIARLHLIAGVDDALKTVGLGLDEVVDLLNAEIGATLAGRQLAIDELGNELAERIAAHLSPEQRDRWHGPRPHAASQPLGEAVVHFCLRILTLRGVVCFAPRSANKAPFVLLAEWLGYPLPSVDETVARAALLRRYLHCHGPSDAKSFASWMGLRISDVEPWWRLIEDELTPVSYNGGRAWMLAEDVPALRSSPDVSGVRLLPPGDPYTQLRDRDSIVGREHRQRVWPTVGAPGTVLADGRIVGIWRPRKLGRKLTVLVESFHSLGTDVIEQLHTEGEQIALLRGAAEFQLDRR